MRTFSLAGVVVALGLGFGCSRQDVTEGTPRSTTSAPAEQVTCPVSGETMAKADMIPVEHEGKTYYLCCSDCLGKFKADPQKYIEPSEPVEDEPEAGPTPDEAAAPTASEDDHDHTGHDH